MSLLIRYLYHWSPATARAGILRRGLLPRTETAVWVRPEVPTRATMGHGRADLPENTILTVCCGTTPGTAWAYSGALSGERGSTWDLWEIAVAEDDEVHYRPSVDGVLDEVRIANRIPKRRCWFVGSRTVPQRGSRWDARPTA